MTIHRTAWHVLFAALISERRPLGFDVQTEKILTLQPQKADLLIIRKQDAQIHHARVLRGLWPLLPEYTVAEFKSALHPPRQGCWIQLCGYGNLYWHENLKAVGSADNLSLVLLAPSKTPTVQKEAQRMGWTFEPLSEGYYRLGPSPHRVFFVDIQAVATRENDPLLHGFGSRTLSFGDKEAAAWLINHTMGKTDTKIQDLEGYDELIQMIVNHVPHDQLVSYLPVEKRLAGLKPEDRLIGLKPEEQLIGLKPEEQLIGLKPEDRVAGLKPEDRVAGLSSEEIVLTLSNDMLRRLSQGFIEALSPEVQAEIQRRLHSSR